ncbi:SGNH/GDSL hydrolase family protein [Nocardioides sp. NPDC006273]|uniref:SGNH/GDSL hydrolase family protein n=1 Tax=Nocardioides sp. NPDC006273 TaxID=3155598 RepID=UPI0033BC92AD
MSQRLHANSPGTKSVGRLSGVRIVLLGDSHLARVQRDLPRLGKDVVNAAAGGATVHDLATQAAAASVRPDDVVVLSIGTNDAAPWRKVPAALVREVLEQFLRSCDADRCVVILPPGVIEARLNGSGDRTNALLEDYQAAVTAAAAAAEAEIMDSKAELSALGPSAFASDGLHLSGEGYRVLLSALRTALHSEA